MKKKSEKEMKRKRKEFQTPYSLKNAVIKGNAVTRLSFLIMGMGNICHKQFIKGCLYLLAEVSFILYMIKNGIYNLSMLPSLGTLTQQKVWNEKKGVFEYTAGDNSVLILLYGVTAIFLIATFLMVWKSSVTSAYKAEILAKTGKHVNNFREDVRTLFHQNIHKMFLSLPLTGILLFTILPLVFMITMAFTNYSKKDDHVVLFDWVGLKNFEKVLSFQDSIGTTFWSVLGWTIVWAFAATFLNYIFGMILAILINRKETKAKGFYRFCFIMTIAIPQFVSLLVMRIMLNENGIVNKLLQNAGFIDTPLPFWTNATWARIAVIVINMWVGIPYTLMLVTGILNNIPGELYESAKIDGASSVQVFFKITLPYMLFVTTPYLITQFTGNVNNFNVIYLLSGGDPATGSSTAGKTDLLVTWLYKLTIDKQYYNLGAVIGILTFIVLAIVALVTYRNSTSFKDEEGFQ